MNDTVGDALATNQIHFYSMITAIISGELLSKYTQK